jgi:hypothetical protein
VSRALAAIRHALADLQVGHRGVFLDHEPRAAVTQHGVFTELGFHLPQRAVRAVQLHHVPDLPYPRRIAGHLPQDPFLVNAGRLGSAADQRVCRTDEDLMRECHWIRDLVDDDVADSFANDLLHRCMETA